MPVPPALPPARQSDHRSTRGVVALSVGDRPIVESAEMLKQGVKPLIPDVPSAVISEPIVVSSRINRAMIALQLASMKYAALQSIRRFFLSNDGLLIVEKEYEHTRAISNYKNIHFEYIFVL